MLSIRLNSLLLTSLLCLATYGCDGSDSDGAETETASGGEAGGAGINEEDGGAGSAGNTGQGGVAGETIPGGVDGLAGEAGMGGESEMTNGICGDIPTYNLNEEGTREGDSFTLSGQTGDQNRTDGSCSTMGEDGSEAVVIFTAPSEGDWEIRTSDAEPTFDTLVYARSTCDDPMSEISCNDDIELGRIRTSRLNIRLEADQTVYIVVDHWSGTDAEPFFLLVRPFVVQNPPVLSGGSLVINDEDKTVGFYAEGSDPEADVALATINLIGSDGNGIFGQDGSGFTLVLGESGTDYSSFFDQQEDGSFTAAVFVTFAENADLSPFQEGTLVVADREAQRSNELALTSEPAMTVARGEACNYVTITCEPESACVNGTCADPQSAAACPEDWEVTNLEVAADGSAQIAGDNTEAIGLRRGSCGGGGATQIYSYTAMVDGTFLVDMEGLSQGADPVVYVRRLCDYNLGVWGRDISCSDNRSEDDLNATAFMTLEAGETVYIFADAFYGGVDTDGDGQNDMLTVRGQGQYSLNISPAAVPEVTDAAAYINREENRVGFRIEWNDADGDVVQLATTFLDIDGQPLVLLGDETTTGFLGISQPDVTPEGTYTFEAALDFDRLQDINLDINAATQVEVYLVDRAQQESDRQTLDFVDPPVLNADSECDPLRILNACPDGQGCIDADPEDPVPAQCSAATEPVLTSASLYTGRMGSDQMIAIRAEGSDAETDIVGFRVQFFNEAGEPLLDAAATLAFTESTITDNNVSAYGLYNRIDELQDLHSAQVRFIDAAGFLSEGLDIFISDATALAVGAACSANRIWEYCGDNSLCIQDAVGESTCEDVPLSCSADWTVINLAEFAQDAPNAWSYEGDAGDGAALMTSGTCNDGSATQSVFSLVATDSGALSCALDAGVEDTVLYARSHCGSEVVGAELACNDDDDEGDLSPGSRVIFEVARDQEIYLFVDAFDAVGFEGPYTLTCQITPDEMPVDPMGDPEADDE